MNEAFFFAGSSPGVATLFGICTSPVKSNASDIGVLFCHAFSEERQKSYRSTFLFAQELSKAGIPSMRFDYGGTGDSQLDLRDISIDSMTDDTICAFTEAKRRLGVQKLAVLGIRLGAVMALGASLKLPDLDTLLLWNPIVVGKSYYRDLSRTELMIRLGSNESGNSKTDVPDGFVELDAEFISPSMVDQLKNIDLAESDFSITRCFVAGRENDTVELKQIDRLVQHLHNNNVATTSWAEEERDYWTSESMYAAFHPRKSFDASLAYLRQLKS